MIFTLLFDLQKSRVSLQSRFLVILGLVDHLLAIMGTGMLNLLKHFNLQKEYLYTQVNSKLYIQNCVSDCATYTSELPMCLRLRSLAPLQIKVFSKPNYTVRELLP